MKKSSLFISIGLSVLIIVWMAVGMLNRDENINAKEVSTAQEKISNELTVEVREQHATSVVSYIITQGTVMPDRDVVVRAETAGKIHDIVIKEGNDVTENSLLAKMNIDDRMIRLERAKAQTTVEKNKYNALKNLGKRGYTAQTRIDEALAILKAAQADEKTIQIDIAHTHIKAPFAGVIDSQDIEKGDYVSIGDALFTIVDNDPLVITAFVPQKEISALTKGGNADIILATGEQRQGTIRFIAPRANQATRSFRVEIAIPNPDHLPSGISATAHFPKQSVMAHFISTSLLTLDENGDVGVKTVNEQGLVAFHSIHVVNSTKEGIYVSGLPKEALIIINGQAFVRAGDNVAFVKSTVSLEHTNEHKILSQIEPHEVTHADH